MGLVEDIKKRMPEQASAIMKQNNIYPKRKFQKKKRAKRKIKFASYIKVETEYSFLYNYNLVKWHYLANKDITEHQLEMFFILHHIILFTKTDYLNLPFAGVKPRFTDLKKKGWITTLSIQKLNMTKMYTLSHEAKKMIVNFHQILLDEVPITSVAPRKLLSKASEANKGNIIKRLMEMRQPIE